MSSKFQAVLTEFAIKQLELEGEVTRLNEQLTAARAEAADMTELANNVNVEITARVNRRCQELVRVHTSGSFNYM
jgi:ABC-type transporter Mla subunit MlaD